MVNRYGIFLIAFLVVTACAPRESTPGKDTPGKSAKQPHQVVSNTDQSPQKHGMLAPPDLHDSLPEISKQSINYHPVRQDMNCLSGRYFDPIPVPGSRWVAACLRGLDVFQSDTSGSLELIKSLHTRGHAWNLCLVNDTIWVADGYAGVVVFDGTTFAEVASWPDLDNARYITTNDDITVVCRHRSGATLLQNTVDVTPRVLAHLTPSCRIMSACLDDTMLYLGTLGGGYIAYSISDPEHPECVWTFEGPDRIVWCRRINSIHWLVDRDFGIWILEDKGKHLPVKCADLPLQGQTRRAAVYGDKMLLLARQAGLTALDISRPLHPVKQDTLPSSNEGRGIACSGDTIFFCDGDWGVKSIRYQNDKLKVNSSYQQNCLLTDIAVSGKYGFATNTHAGLQIINLENSSSLEITTTLKGLTYPVGIDTQGCLAAVADYDGLALIDITDPANPRIQSHFSTPGRATSVCLQGDKAFVADWFDGLHIIDISKPESPFLLSSLDLPGWSIDVVAANEYAYVCCVNGGLAAVDCSDPRKPLLSSIEKTCIGPEGIAIQGNALYLADFNTGLLVYRLDRPLYPEPVAWVSLNVCKGVQASGTDLYVSNYIYGVKRFNIEKPFEPVLVGKMDTPGKAYETAVIPGKPDMMLVADWHDLLMISWTSGTAANGIESDTDP
jgi:hypothetical protein